MILLWLLVAVLILVVMALLIWPLLRDDVEEAPDRAIYDLTVYRDQLGEIDRDVARGLLSAEQAETARLEIQRRMLAVAGTRQGTPDAEPEADDAGRASSSSSRFSFKGGFSLKGLGARLRGAVSRVRAQGAWGLLTLAGIGAVLPFGALALYLMLGSPSLPAQPYAQRIAQEEQQHLARLPSSVRTKLAELKEAAEAHPNDVHAWLELGRAYRRVEDHDHAVEALEHARTLGPEGPEKAAVLSDLAESLIITHDGLITDRIHALFLDALREDPTDARARFYLGVAAVQNDEPLAALAIWRDLQQTSSPDDAWMPMLRQQIGMVAQENGIAPESIEPLHPLKVEAGEPVVRRDVPAPATPSPEGAAGAGHGTGDGPRMRAQADGARAPGQGLSADEKAMVEGMVEGLANKLKEHPDDLQGWQRLAQSYRVLGRLDDAVTALGRAAALAPNDVGVLSAQAEAMIASARARGEREPPQAVYQIYNVILKQQPDNPNALYFVGRAAAEAGDPARARDLWERLLQRIPPDAPAHASLQRQIKALASAGAGSGTGQGDGAAAGQ